MAKKKKRNSRKKVARVEREPSMFWRGARGVVLLLLAILLVMGGFGAGGSLSNFLFDTVYKALGLAAYLVPLALIYWAFHKFKNEEKTVPLRNLLSMLSLLIVSAAWLHAGFADKDRISNLYNDGFGGAVGAVVGGALLTLLDKIPASVLLFILMIVTFCWTFSIPLLEILRGFTLPRGEADTDLNELKMHEDRGFKLNEGVPVEHHTGKVTLKNSAPKSLAKQDDHSALTTVTDPDWQLPSVNLLIQKQDKADAGDVNTNVDTIRETFENFNYEIEMQDVNIGPRVTQYTIKPPAGVKLSKIAALDDNLAYSLAAQSIRIEAPIPGKKAVGIEVPNVKAATVRIASLLDSEQWKKDTGMLSFVVGRDIAGLPIIANLEKMPHLLIAGQTASGKSVMVNSLLASFLYRNSPSDLKLILVDPKHVELSMYNEIPHLLTPVITEPEKCISALKWAVSEMERRYRMLAGEHKRNIAEYNAVNAENQMPSIVIVIDELADLMMMAARDVEALIVRIAQKARAVGIHLVLATQRPSVDVITGLIKANIPARISFTVASQVDSRTILDQVGAEKLLGMGDMLFSTADMPKPKRIQGALIMGEETQKVTDFLRMQRPPQYDDEVVSQPVQLNGKGGIVAPMDNHGSDSDDDMFKDAVRVVIENRKASTSLLQRRLRIGYGRASRLVDEMEEQGIVGHADGSKPREVLVTSLDDVFGIRTSDEVLDENFPENNT
ncbi:MAG: DNA translocase FtsK [bacterium]|nr:DNA translocase FtsK [bacterium]